MPKKITALIIMDGYAEREEAKNNAIKQDGSKYITQYKAEFPNTLLNASGLAVGLPEGQMGNSEVGHLNIGAGRVVYQELTRITKSIIDGDFFENKAFIQAINNCKKNNTKLHLMGLLSDGGVHSHIEHLFALIKLAKDSGLDNVYIHAFLDGRDVPPSSGIKFIAELEAKIKELNFGEIASVSGRYYAMDRDNRWDRVEKAYNALVLGIGETSSSAAQAIQNSYDNKIVDEFVLPTIITKNNEPVAQITKQDSVIFFNFRPDRAREITRTLVDPDFDGFARKEFFDVCYVCMTQYNKDFQSFKNLSVAFGPSTLENTLGEYISSLGLKQLRIAETEKYAHVTFFFNGGVEKANNLEDRALINSPKVATYDLKPEMSAYEVTEEALVRINSGEYDLIILNFANSDMVGHTGVISAAMKAVHTVDECTHKLVERIRELGGVTLITADHGNSDMMFDEENQVAFTAHTTNPVPLIMVDDNNKSAKLREGGCLADIAPTLLKIMNLEIPKEMTGKSLII